MLQNALFLPSNSKSMKRFSLLFFLLIFGVGTAQDISVDSATPNNYEHILSFDSDIQISKDAEVMVTEKIKVYAEGLNIKRGIFRSLPLWRNINGKKERISYDIISIQKDGVKENKMNELGISILRFSDDEVLKDMENVLRAIEFYIFEYEKHTPNPSQEGS